MSQPGQAGGADLSTDNPDSKPSPSSHKTVLIAAGVAGVIVIVAVVLLILYFTVWKKNQDCKKLGNKCSKDADCCAITGGGKAVCTNGVCQKDSSGGSSPSPPSPPSCEDTGCDPENNTCCDSSPYCVNNLCQSDKPSPPPPPPPTSKPSPPTSRPPAPPAPPPAGPAQIRCGIPQGTYSGTVNNRGGTSNTFTLTLEINKSTPVLKNITMTTNSNASFKFDPSKQLSVALPMTDRCTFDQTTFKRQNADKNPSCVQLGSKGLSGWYNQVGVSIDSFDMNTNQLTVTVYNLLNSSAVVGGSLSLKAQSPVSGQYGCVVESALKKQGEPCFSGSDCRSNICDGSRATGNHKTKGLCANPPSKQILGYQCTSTCSSGNQCFSPIALKGVDANGPDAASYCLPSSFNNPAVSCDVKIDNVDFGKVLPVSGSGKGLSTDILGNDFQLVFNFGEVKGNEMTDGVVTLTYKGNKNDPSGGYKGSPAVSKTTTPFVNTKNSLSTTFTATASMQAPFRVMIAITCQAMSTNVPGNNSEPVWLWNPSKTNMMIVYNLITKEFQFACVDLGQIYSIGLGNRQSTVQPTCGRQGQWFPLSMTPFTPPTRGGSPPAGSPRAGSPRAGSPRAGSPRAGSPRGKSVSARIASFAAIDETW